MKFENYALEGRIAANLKEGQKVYYHNIISDPHDGVVRKIESKPWQLGHGAWVVKVSDKSGGVSVRALTPIAESTDPWFGKIIFDNEGIIDMETFETEAEAKAFVKGYKAAEKIVEAFGGDNALEDHQVVHDQLATVDE